MEGYKLNDIVKYNDGREFICQILGVSRSYDEDEQLIDIEILLGWRPDLQDEVFEKEELIQPNWWVLNLKEGMFDKQLILENPSIIHFNDQKCYWVGEEDLLLPEPHPLNTLLKILDNEVR